MSIGETYTESLTKTYTIADVGKVLDCFAADLDGMGQSTGLMTREYTKAVGADVKLMAQLGYLSDVCVYLENGAGATIRAAKYEVMTRAGALTASRPGNYLWPRTPGGRLRAYITYSQKWRELPFLQRVAFEPRLRLSWFTFDLDTSFPMLTPRHDRNYISNGFGLQKTIFE